MGGAARETSLRGALENNTANQRGQEGEQEDDAQRTCHGRYLEHYGLVTL